jgi:hypothetical protein
VSEEKPSKNDGMRIFSAFWPDCPAWRSNLSGEPGSGKCFDLAGVDKSSWFLYTIGYTAEFGSLASSFCSSKAS